MTIFANGQRCDLWVSLKIMTADSTVHSRELSTVRSLMTHSHGSLCSKFFVQLLDDFVHKGPNGSHQCLVFELLGPTFDHVIADYSETNERLEPEIILKLSEQLLQAVGYLHKAGYVHGGMVAYSCVTKTTSSPGSRRNSFYSP